MDRFISEESANEKANTLICSRAAAQSRDRERLLLLAFHHHGGGIQEPDNRISPKYARQSVRKRGVNKHQSVMILIGFSFHR